MDNHTATEQAYKNGYAMGYKKGRDRAQKHGEWENLRKAYNDVPRSRCSLCGREIIGLESDYNFCPKCGAKMDGEIWK